MKSKTLNYYDWFEDLKPQILENLNEILAEKGINPVRDLHGGAFKDGKWVGILESEDYRNYWHVWLELWGEGVRNDSYDTVWFPNIHDDDSDDGWSWVYEKAEQFATERNKDHSDPKWACDLVTAVRKMLKDNGFCKDLDGEEIVIWYSW